MSDSLTLTFIESEGESDPTEELDPLIAFQQILSAHKDSLIYRDVARAIAALCAAYVADSTVDSGTVDTPESPRSDRTDDFGIEDSPRSDRTDDFGIEDSPRSNRTDDFGIDDLPDSPRSNATDDVPFDDGRDTPRSDATDGIDDMPSSDEDETPGDFVFPSDEDETTMFFF